MAKHTPGPWEVRTGHTYHRDGSVKTRECFVALPRDQRGDDVAIASDISDPLTEQPSDANACLISAVPDLLAVCEALLKEQERDGTCESPECPNCSLQALARAAIAKAKGETTP